jgi:hypothetical protein
MQLQRVHERRMPFEERAKLRGREFGSEDEYRAASEPAFSRGTPPFRRRSDERQREDNGRSAETCVGCGPPPSSQPRRHAPIGPWKSGSRSRLVKAPAITPLAGPPKQGTIAR